jgi:DNA-binding NarL/FixJ family response regulator
LGVLLNGLSMVSVVQEIAVSQGSWQEQGGSGPCWSSIDVVIFDAVPSPEAHLDFIYRLQHHHGHLKLIVVVEGDDRGVVAELIEREIDGILTPDDLADSLGKAVQQVAAGQRVVSSNIVIKNLRRHARGGRSAASDQELTVEELRIIHMVAEGLTNREIALREFVSEPTVKRRTQRVYRKLQARDRAHAVALAARRGIL